MAGVNVDYPALDDVYNEQVTNPTYTDPGAQGNGTGGYVPDTNDPNSPEMLAAAADTGRHAGPYNPTDIAAANGFSATTGVTTPGWDASGQNPLSPGTGGMPSLPNAGVGGGNPGAGGTNTAGFNQPLSSEGTPVGPKLPGAGGNLSDIDRLVKDAGGKVVGVRSANGYYDPEFQGTIDAPGKQSMMTEYQQGDRMAGTINALEILARAGLGDLSTSAQRALGAAKATGSDVTNSQFEQNALAQHNAQIDTRLANGAFGNNQAMRDNLLSQKLAPNTTPLSDAQAFPMRQQILGDLAKVSGVTGISTDGYNNITFKDPTMATAQNPEGIRHIPMDQWPQALDQIKARLDQQNAATAPPSGGRPSSAPRGNTPPPDNTLVPPQPEYKGNAIVPTQWPYNPPGTIRPY